MLAMERNSIGARSEVESASTMSSLTGSLSAANRAARSSTVGIFVTVDLYHSITSESILIVILQPQKHLQARSQRVAERTNDGLPASSARRRKPEWFTSSVDLDATTLGRMQRAGSNIRGGSNKASWVGKRSSSEPPSLPGETL